MLKAAVAVVILMTKAFGGIIVFSCARFLHGCVQWMLGRFGTSQKADREDSYETSARVLRVRARHKFDPIACGNFLSDFITVDETFEHPNYVLKPEVSLYHIGSDSLVFVECQKGENPWNVKDYVFSRIGQCNTAIRAIILPMRSAHRLVEEMAGNRTSKDRLLFVAMTARCGSMLLSRLLEETGECAVYTEPYVVCDLMRYVPDDDSTFFTPEQCKLVNTVVTLLTKPDGSPAELRVIKMQPQNTYLCRIFRQVYPEACFLFMYRDLKPNCVSFIKALQATPLMIMVLLYSIVSDRLAEALMKRHGHHHPHKSPPIALYDTKTVYGHVAFLALMGIQGYLRLLNSQFPIQAIKYEDIVRNPQAATQAIFEYIGLKSSLVSPAMAAFQVDSQNNTAYKRSELEKTYLPPFTEVCQSEIRTLCDTMGIPDLLRNQPLPGTITGD